jgi:cell wall-associated NlpC family hydrolase
MMLDQLSDQYNKAIAQAAAASQRLADVEAQGAVAQADQTRLEGQTADAVTALRQAALDAYLSHILPHLKGGNPSTQAYQLAIAGVYTGSAIETASQRVKDLHEAQRQLRTARQQVANATSQAEVENATAQSARQAAQTAAAQAAAHQIELTATLAQVQGELANIVAAQRASIAQDVYNRISQAGNLLFKPSGKLAPQLPETARALSIALGQVGKPYVWGATGPDSFDCSGLMQWSWAQTGVRLPRVSQDQQVWATPVPISELQPGDLVFFGNPAHHVAMYVGNGMMVDAPHSGANVEVVSIWWSELSGFGRVHP